jgi:putative membrane protein
MKNKIRKIISFTEDYEKKEDIILRDHLAMERTKLANERTLFSYIRTSLYLVLGGIAFLGMKDLKEFYYVGYFSLITSVVLIIVGIIRYYQLKNHLKKLYKPLKNSTTKNEVNKSPKKD